MRHFSVDKGKDQKENGKNGPKKRLSIFQDEEKMDIWDPPLLYKKPDDEAFKWMVRRYLAKKNLL